MATYDVFISYPHALQERVRPIKHALERAGARVWFDENEVDNFESITLVLDRGIRHSKVLLAFFEDEYYPKSRACQWELTTAFIAAQNQGDPRGRVLVVNPSSGADHIQPGELRDALFPKAPESTDETGLAALANNVLESANGVSGAFGGIQPLAQPRWFGYQGFGSNRFVGRIAQMWELHSALNADTTVAITGRSGPARLQGMGGVGKSLLAEEYALRFAPAYPGGVFWLRAYGNDDTKEQLSSQQREAQRDGQLRSFATALELETAGLSSEEVKAALAGKIAGREERCLWVVDDLPSGLSRDELGHWLAPHPLARTLITTRNRDHDALGTSIELGVLNREEAYQLLSKHRTPKGEAEVAAVRGILADVGFHTFSRRCPGGIAGECSEPMGVRDIQEETDEHEQGCTEISGETPGVVTEPDRDVCSDSASAQYRAVIGRG